MKQMKQPATRLAVMICCFLCMATVKNYAQSGYQKGNSLLNVSLGVGSPFFSGLSGSISPGVSYEYGVTEAISIGAGISRSVAKDNYYNIKYAGTLVSVRGSYHFELSEKLDPYIGVNLGYINVSVKSDDEYFGDFSVGSGIGYGAFVGMRYFPVNNIGVHAELGYTSLSILTLGASFKF